MVTCIDIATLYKEKRGKAVQLAQTLCRFSHPFLVKVYNHVIYEDQAIYIEMEVP